MEFFNKLNFSVLLYSIILVVLGVCFVAMPNEAWTTICYVIGGMMMLLGICSFVSYFVDGFDRFGIVNGTIQFLVGLLVVIFAGALTDMGVFAIIAGVIILVSGIYKVQNSFDLKAVGVKRWWLYLIYAILVAVLGLLIIIHPVDGQEALLIFMGITLILDGIMNIITMCIFGNKVKHIKDKFLTPIIIEPKEIKHEDDDKHNK